MTPRASAIHVAATPGVDCAVSYYGVAIDAAKQGCWYARWEDRGSRVRYHRFGDDPAKDVTVFGEGLGPVEIPYVQLSENGRWLMVTVFKGSSSTDTRIWVRSAAGTGAFASVTDTLHALVNATFAGDQLVIRSDWKAPNLRLFVTDAANPGPSHWRVLVPERTDAALESYSVACGRVFVKYLHDVLPGDTYLLCSDGLSDMLDDESIAQLLSGAETLPEAAGALIDAANDAGGKDNISVVLARVRGHAGPTRSWWPFRR